MKYAVEETYCKFERNHCLSRAQNAADSAGCEREYEEKMASIAESKEKDKEREKCMEAQIYVLKEWGTPEDYAKSITYEIKRKYNKPQGNEFFYSVESAISQLRDRSFSDIIGEKVFSEKMEEFGLRSIDARKAIELYYDNELYKGERYKDLTEKLSKSNSPSESDKIQAQMNDPSYLDIGRRVSATKDIFVEMGLLDDDNIDIKDNPPPDNKTYPVPPSKPIEEPEQPNEKTPEPSDYSAIEKIVIDHYLLNHVGLTKAQKESLDEVASLMMQYPNIRICLNGNTCDLGSNYINNRISTKRANHAKNYLVRKGIDPNRIEIASKASSEPAVVGKSGKARLLNRRVTISVLNN